MSHQSPALPELQTEQPRVQPLGRARSAAAMRPVLWRLHFLAGFRVAPVLVSLAVTGILFAWNP